MLKRAQQCQQPRRMSKWQTHDKGRMTAQSTPGTLQARGGSEVDNMIIAMIQMNERTKASQKRLRIRGTSMKKLERSTSFLVAPHVILYEKR